MKNHLSLLLLLLLSPSLAQATPYNFQAEGIQGFIKFVPSPSHVALGDISYALTGSLEVSFDDVTKDARLSVEFGNPLLSLRTGTLPDLDFTGVTIDFDTKLLSFNPLTNEFELLPFFVTDFYPALLRILNPQIDPYGLVGEHKARLTGFQAGAIASILDSGELKLQPIEFRSVLPMNGFIVGDIPVAELVIEDSMIGAGAPIKLAAVDPAPVSQPCEVPEPLTAAMVGLGLLAARRRNK